MKKKILLLFLTIGSVVLLPLTSCGDDDDENDNNNNKPVPTDTTDVTPAIITDDTTTVENDTTTVKEEEKVVQYTLDDVQGIWHVKKASGQEEYIHIDGVNTHIIRYNTSYMGEDNWLSLKLTGTNVTNNLLGFSASFLTNTYGYTLKKVSDTEMLAQPKSEYFENDDFSIDDVILTKESELPARFTDPSYLFQFSMDYTNY
ncbi:MAG: hypothetical protein J6T28_11685 [Paludibacteraceae bacterium]|nr:hypothetical protein [Paludibacteraceae bacterium]MBP5480382.1 hypothetical protein [Paludibacteraceae bacterium]